MRSLEEIGFVFECQNIVTTIRFAAEGYMEPNVVPQILIEASAARQPDRPVAIPIEQTVEVSSRDGP